MLLILIKIKDHLKEHFYNILIVSLEIKDRQGVIAWIERSGCWAYLKAVDGLLKLVLLLMLFWHPMPGGYKVIINPLLMCDIYKTGGKDGNNGIYA
ncbi:MAG: hypothetical protein JRI33_07165 [Deltaproteobacteria bacterium]|nr:hypothetical protein [Deltaproteobacteria bacterium]